VGLADVSGVRKLVPPQLHGVARRAYIRAGQASAGLRITPSFVMLGASRAGTTSLFRALSAHPQVVRPTVNKGVRYFDLNYAESWDWYLGHFPLNRTARKHAQGGPPAAFEASGYYLFHPFVAERMAEQLPQVRMLAMLRDPVERAYSAWKHESARGFETETFERALDLEDERLAGEVERMAADPRYESHAHRHQSHRSRGEYVDQLERFLQHFPREQLHVLRSEAFFAEPAEEYERVTRFLGLSDHQPASFDVHNARPSSPMPEAIHDRLRAHFAPYNARLATLLGEDPGWS
jgi:hypothetical protein